MYISLIVTLELNKRLNKRLSEFSGWIPAFLSSRVGSCKRLLGGLIPLFCGCRPGAKIGNYPEKRPVRLKKSENRIAH